MKATTTFASNVLARAATCVAIQCFCCFVAVAGDTSTTDDAAVFPGKEWAISTPEEQGMDSARLARLVESVGTAHYDSLTIVRHGRIVVDAYYAPYLAGISHDLRSVTKSVTGTLTAIEIAHGLLDSADQKVLDLFPDKPVANIDDNKKAITVQNLLDMTSGLAWTEKNYTPDETVMRMYEAPDPAGFVLDQPMAAAPGTQFVYDSGNPYLLSAIISRETGQNAFEYAKKELFRPLGIKSARWPRTDRQGVTDGEAGLSLSPRDMARIGYLYLRNGNWSGQQIIPASWVERAKGGQVSAPFGLHYANLWWSLPEKGAYMALGRHSQRIIVVPRLDIVAVLTGSLRDDAAGYSLGRLTDELSDAARSDTALPTNPVASSLLVAAIRQAATEQASAVGTTPSLAKAISGKVFAVEDNALHVTTFTLNFFDTDSSWEITTKPLKPERPVQRFSGLMGLNGVYRKSPPALYGINATRGRWLSEHEFEIERRILGHSEVQFWTFDFDGDKVAIKFENTDGYKQELHGAATEE